MGRHRDRTSPFRAPRRRRQHATREPLRPASPLAPHPANRRHPSSTHRTIIGRTFAATEDAHAVSALHCRCRYAQKRYRAPKRIGRDQRELSLLMSRSPSSTSQSTSDSPPKNLICASTVSSIGPSPTRKPPVGPRLSAHDFSKNLPSCAASPGVRLVGTPTKVPRMS